MAEDGNTDLDGQGNNTGAGTDDEGPTFADSLPEELRESEHLKDVRDIGTLAKSYVELRSAQPVIPEAPDGYEIPDIPEGLNGDEKGITAFKELAHKLGLPQETVTELVKFDLARAQGYDDAFKKQIEDQRAEAEQGLKTLWGNKYDAEKEVAATGLRMVLKGMKDGEAVEAQLAQQGFLDQPAVMRIFNQIGHAVSEDAFVTSKTKGEPGIERSEDGRPMLSYPSMDEK